MPNFAKLWLYRAVARIARRRPAPNSIPMSAPGAYKNNYYSVRMSSDADRWEFLALAITPYGIEGLWFNGIGQGGLKCTLLNASIPDFRIKIVHYLKGFVNELHSPIGFLLYHLSGWGYFVVVCERIQQFFFNRKRLARTDRMKILQLFFDKTLEDRNFETSGTDLMTILYSQRWAEHPRYEQMLGYYQIVLESLKASGDLKGIKYGYTLAPQALTTLSQFGEDNRRHSDNKKIQWTIAGLTGVLAALAAVQIGTSIWVEEHPDALPVIPQVTSSGPVYPASPPSFD